MTRFHVIVLTFCTMSTALFAQSKRPVQLIVNCSCEDAVGAGVATSMRDRIASSPRYNEVADSKQNEEDSLEINAVSMDDSGNNAQLSTAISFVILYKDMMLDHWVQICGRNNIKQCADSDFAMIDKKTQDIMNTPAGGLKTTSN